VRILVVEDDPKLSSILRDGLEKQAYRVTTSQNGHEGLALGRDYPFELILLDAMLPGLDGFSIAKELRRSRVTTNIMMLTSRDATSDKVRGLDSGVDDYLTKPFSFEELFARLRALARRGTSAKSLCYEVGDLRLDPTTHVATRAGSPIALTRTEHLLLEYLMRNPDVVLRRDSIINAVWGYETTVENNTLDAFMKQLRLKVDSAHERKLIQTVRGFGYKMSAGHL
jgi:DNA-binding response OmpR family regulator